MKGVRSARQPGTSAKSQVRRSTSARLSEVRDSSRRMRPPKFLPTVDGGGARVLSRFHPARSVFDTRCCRAGRACRSSLRRAQRRWPPTGRRLPARTPGERHRPRYPPVHRGGRAGRGGHRGVCLLLARLRGRPGTRRDRDHRPAEPATIDGLVYASSMVVLYAARHRVPVPSLARWLLVLGIAATLTANMAQGWSHGPVGAVVAAWPAVSLVGSYELLVWLIRTSGAAGRGPPAEHLCNGAACRAAVRPVPASAVDGERPGGSERDTSDPAWRPAGQAAGQSPIPASGQRDDEVLAASAVNDAAVAAYQLSVQAGNPLSERRLAQMFGRTSRRWARARIADARQASPLPDSPSTPVTACVGGLGRSGGYGVPAGMPY